MSNSYRLGVNPSAYYLDLFDPEDINIRPAIVDAQRPRDAEGELVISGEDLEFEIYLALEDGAVSKKAIEATRSVLSQVVEMDDAARAAGDDFDYDEELGYIEIKPTTAVFHYFATTVNSEWAVTFVRNQAGVWVRQDAE